MKPRKLELLSPAANSEIAMEAILHGADAVYIGPPTHGARKSASNSIEEIEKVVNFAHQYRAKVYATVNTIVYDNEIKQVETLCHDLYHAGVDALIVQDMGILRMKIPPISLHASTQCDIRTPEKAKFLERVGFSQLVLARELTLEEIRAITSEIKIPVETFIHGALCVCYSGRCHASQALTGRSANRGECAQICRFPYTLKDSKGKSICKDKYLLSLKDFNATHKLTDLIEAGVSSFKIEGRLKDASYVKNITAFYNQELNKIISGNKEKYQRSSFGDVSINFQPKPDKSFNRGFTEYFLSGRKPLKIASLLTPKSQGEPISDISELNNGDGISFYDKEGNFTGVNINRIEHKKIIPAKRIKIPDSGEIFRTSDVKWEKLLATKTGKRKLNLNIQIDEKTIRGKDQRGCEVIIPNNLVYEKAEKKQDYKSQFEKLGNTIYDLKDFKSYIPADRFYRNSELSELRRRLIHLLDSANRINYPFEYRRKEEKDIPYPEKFLDYRDNVSNQLAMEFYRQHGVEKIEKAAEIRNNLREGEQVMLTRHCVLRELGMCKKTNDLHKTYKFPLYLHFDKGKFRLEFDCKSCEMNVLLT